jgi:hypothetical protein
MTQVQTDAIKKLQDKKQRDGAKSRHAAAVYDAVRDALIGFCEQQQEFADAILQGKSLGECCEEIMKGCGSSISDLDVYAKAVEFYFPGAKIEMKMTVYMSEFEREERQDAEAPKKQTSAKILDLKFEDLFGLGGK